MRIYKPESECVSVTQIQLRQGNSMSKKKKDLTSWIEAGKQNLATWKRENPAGGNLRHGVFSTVVRKKYKDKRTLEGKAVHSIMKAIEKDIGKPFDARQSLLISLIRSKVIIVMQIGKYLESQEEIVDYEKGTVPHVVDKTFFHASNSLRGALNELYNGKNSKQRGKKTYEDIVKEMNNAGAAATASSSDLSRGRGPSHY